MSERIERYRWPLMLLIAILLASGGVAFLLRQPSTSGYLEIRLPTPTVVAPKEIKVYVTGAVQRWGVVAVREGARVEDALQAAGGPTDDADLVRINLAVLLKDEMQIHVPRQGETESVVPISGASAGKININSASVEELDTLPDIG